MMRIIFSILSQINGTASLLNYFKAPAFGRSASQSTNRSSLFKLYYILSARWDAVLDLFQC